MADIAVKPAREGMGLSHPSAGLLPDEGGLWPEDQFTYRRLRDRDIKRLPDDDAAEEPDAAPNDAGAVVVVSEELDPHPTTEESDPIELGSKRKGKA